MFDPSINKKRCKGKIVVICKIITTGMHDEIPVCQNNYETISKLRFCPFTTVVQRARKWLQSQKVSLKITVPGIILIQMVMCPLSGPRPMSRLNACKI